MFDGVLGDEVDDSDGAGLVLAPCTGDALFKLGWVPREIAVHDDAGDLEVEADAAGIGAEEEAAIGIVMENADLAAAVLLRDGAGVPGKADVGFLCPFADFPQHAFPLGEDDDFHIGIGESIFEDACELLHFWAVLALAIFDDGGRITDHAHHTKQNHQ